MRSLVFFNNKGGVGKTTLACNFAHYLATNGVPTVVLDLDPQCNTTQLMLDEVEWEEIYSDVATAEAASVLRPLRPIRAGDSTVDAHDLPIRRSKRFLADIIPGHPGLSTLEDEFGASWREFRGGTPGAARRTCWLRALNAVLSKDYEVVIVDVGPSLGAINRTVLIGCDHFVTPMAPDLFSLFALDNISSWLTDWLAGYQLGVEATRPRLEELKVEDLIPDVLPIASGFVGYTVQQYYTTIRGRERRRIAAYENHRAEIPARAAELVKLSKFDATELDLGTVPNMFSMIPLAQSTHAPISSLTQKDGVRGAQVSQQQRYTAQLAAIFEALAARIRENPS